MHLRPTLPLTLPANEAWRAEGADGDGDGDSQAKPHTMQLGAFSAQPKENKELAKPTAAAPLAAPVKRSRVGKH